MKHSDLPDDTQSRRLWLVRHGETEWSKLGRHTGRKDVPLTVNGRRRARVLQPILAQESFSTVLVSPLQRARETAELAGLLGQYDIDEDLVEWDYGDYEGLTTKDLIRDLGAFSTWTTPLPNGEKLEEVAARADRVLQRLNSVSGQCLLFAHGHFLRILATRWLGLDAIDARLLVLDEASLSILGHEHEHPAIHTWNVACRRS